MEQEIQKIGNAFYVVEDMDRAVAFYRDVLGLRLKFRDGDRWAAFDVGGTTVALATAEGAPTPADATTQGGATLSLKVQDVDQWSEQASQRGLSAGAPEVGPHERTVTIVDPDGHRLIVYSPAPGA